MSAPNQAPLLKVPTPGNRPKPRLMIPQSAPGKPFNSTTGVISFPDSTGPGNVSGGVGVGGGVVGDFGSTGPVGAAYNDANDRTVEDAEKSSLTQPISSAQYQAAVPAPLAIGVPSSGSSPAHPKRTPGARPPLPKLQLAMPKPSTGKNTPQPLQVGTISAPSQQQQQQQSQQSSSLSGSADHSKSGTYAQGTGSVNNPASASGPPSSYSALSLAMGIKQSHPHGSGDASGMGSVYEESAEDLTRDLDKLSLELGRPVDADDLDDEGWLAARTSGRIVELDVLGEGAGGAVTKCKLRDGKTVFALKVITTDPNPDVKKQIFREINFNKDCRSDYICRYYGAFMDRSSSTISIAMEFCEGGSLDSIYREVKNLGGRTGEKVLGKVAEGVLNGLTYLHSLKIIHRDIKPSNILLCRNGQVKLCDFGVSGEFGTKGVANTFIGTHYYMAPERITGKPYTITSDVWSLGVTLLEVAQHRFPFPADGTEMQPKSGLIDLLTYIVRQPIPKLKDEPDNGVRWSENFKSFIDYSLERDANLRQPPWQMLEHPWMVEMRLKKVNMALFLKKVWDWKD